VNAAEFTHLGGSNSAVFATAEIQAGDNGGVGTPVAQSGAGDIVNADGDWGTAGSTVQITSNIRLKVDDSDSSLLYLQADLDTGGNGFEKGHFEAKFAAVGANVTRLDPAGWTS
jgi:hypothetical protein